MVRMICAKSRASKAATRHFFVGAPHREARGGRYWEAIVFEAKSRELAAGSSQEVWAVVQADSVEEVLERASVTTRYLNARRMDQGSLA